MQSAVTAKDMILEEYPEAKLTVMDCTFNTVLQGMFVLEACRLRDAGLSYEKIVEEAAEVWMAAEYEGSERTAEEISQLLYHLQVLMVAKGLTPDAVYRHL